MILPCLITLSLKTLQYICCVHIQNIPADIVTGTVASERMLQPLPSSKHDKINEMLLLILVSVGVSF